MITKLMADLGVVLASVPKSTEDLVSSVNSLRGLALLGFLF